MKLKKYDKIEVYWNDTCTHTTKWAEEKTYDYDRDDKYSNSGRTIGYYLRSTKSNMFIAQRLFGPKQDNLDMGGVDSIPLGCILKVRKLK